MRDRSHVGELRPSQLMHTYGVGATVELPELTTLVLGLDDWPRALGEPVSSRGCSRPCARRSARQVEQLLHAARRPRWRQLRACRSRRSRGGCAARCAAGWRRSTAACSRSSPSRGDPSAPATCTTGARGREATRPPTAFPARYLMACQDGHLDDFPWVEFLHGGAAVQGHAAS